MSVIYETRGRAREFCQLAINLYKNCEHGCLYCWGPDFTRQDRLSFESDVKPRPNILTLLKQDCQRLQKAGETRPVLLSFLGDVYQPVEDNFKVTRQAIALLHRHGLKVHILTKGGLRATRDFDLLGPGDAFAITLTTTTPEMSRYWEPGAALPQARIDSLKEAHKLGIETWVSLEPVLYAHCPIELIGATHKFVGHYKVGKLNYHPHAQTIDWRIFAKLVIATLDELGARYYIKRDLARYIGHPEGIRKGLNDGPR